MTPRHFFDNIAELNVNEFLPSFWKERAAVNAILTLDAFFGILFAHLKGISDPTVSQIPDDRRYRDQIASTSVDYQILRDAAFSIKHGELTGTKARLVSRADQVGSSAVTLDDFYLDH